jgi:hypothetical protein
MKGRLCSVGNDVNGGTGACTSVIASGRGGGMAAETVSMRNAAYDVKPSGRGGGRATLSVNMRIPCRGVRLRIGTANLAR